MKGGEGNSWSGEPEGAAYVRLTSYYYYYYYYYNNYYYYYYQGRGISKPMQRHHMPCTYPNILHIHAHAMHIPTSYTYILHPAHTSCTYILHIHHFTYIYIYIYTYTEAEMHILSLDIISPRC